MKSRINRFARIIIIGCTSILILIALASAFISFFYEKAAIRYLKKYLDEHLLTEIQIDKISFHILKGFPNATVELDNVVVFSGSNFSSKDFKPINTDTLLEAKKINFQFGLLDLIRNNYEFKKVEINNGRLNILVDNAGNHNINIWKPTKDSVSKSYSIDLNHIILNSVYLHIISLPARLNLNAIAEKLQCHGLLKNSILTLNANGSLLIGILNINNTDYLVNKTLELQMKSLYEDHFFRISQCDLLLNKMPFHLNGFINVSKQKLVDFNINSHKFLLEDVIYLLPDSLQVIANKYSFSGRGKFTASIKGKLNTANSLNITSDFELLNASISNRNTRTRFEKINVKGTLSGHNLTDLVIKIPVLSTLFGGNTISGKLILYNLKNTCFKCELNSIIDLNKLNDFFEFDSVETLQGTLQAHFIAEGCLKSDSSDLSAFPIDFLKAGAFSLKDVKVKFKNNNLNIQNLSGLAHYNNSLFLDSVSLNLDGNNYLIDGKIDNLLHYLLKKETLYSNLKIYCRSLDVSTYFAKSNLNSTSQTRPTIFPDNIKLKAQVKADEFTAGKFNAHNLQFDMLLIQDTILINDFILNYIDGVISGNALINQDDNHYLTIACHSNNSNININNLFTSFNNFGQSFILDKNVKGRLSGTIDFVSQWDNNLIYIPKNLVADAKIEIQNGELVQFDPMLKLSKYINVDELRHIRFKTLSNEISIQNRVVTIPEMEIHSSAFNIWVSGQQTFDNNFEYHLKVLLSEILFNKAKKKRKEINEFLIDQSNEDQTTIPILIVGNPNNYDVRFDHKKAFDFSQKNNNATTKLDNTKLPTGNYNIEWDEEDSRPVKNEPSDNNKLHDFNVVWDESDSTTAPDNFK